MDRSQLLEGIDQRRALFGLFFAFDNILQRAGDAFYDEITCKQFFLLISLSLFQESHPTIGELSDVMGSSHQNVKQIVNKLEKNGFIKTYIDEEDKRRLRVMTTEKMVALGERYRDKEIAFLERFYEGLSDDEIRSTFDTMLKIENNLMKLRNEFK